MHRPPYRAITIALFAIAVAIISTIPCRAGAILEASCPCGFESARIFAGGGRADFRTVCKAPAYCAACKRMRILNYLGGSPRCPKCRGPALFYDDPTLRERPREGQAHATVFSWNTETRGVFEITNAGHLCPACGKMTLRFKEAGRWD